MDLESYPFSSQRMPVMAANGVVATSQPLAAQAGLTILQRGGNAVDAALAAAVALTVLEPTSNGIGSDAFALVWDGARLHGLNGSGRAPAALQAEELRRRGYRCLPQHGWLPVTVPGAPAAWGDLQARFGRLSLAEIFGPAIRYAEEGYSVTPVTARQWQQAAGRFLAQHEPAVAGWKPTFAPGGRAPRAGERWASPAHARTLQDLARRGVHDFYEGELAEKILAFARATGGLFSAEDLAAHHSRWVEPVSIDYQGYQVWELPPNGQGLAALLALAILAGTDAAGHAHLSESSLHLQIEAMKLAFADAYRYIADPEQDDVPVAGLLDPDYIAGRRAQIGPEARLPEPGQPPAGGTVYLCTVDRDGMMVSYIQSNYQGFGSGVVVPETGIALQNRGACFTLEVGHPNEAAGGKRPFHTIIPGFLARSSRPVGPFGVMGGQMQPQGHLQVVSGMLDYGLNPQAALDAPRWRVMAGREVWLEPGLPEPVLAGLAGRGHALTLQPDQGGFGRGQIIWQLESGVYIAGSDGRSDGAAAGW